MVMLMIDRVYMCLCDHVKERKGSIRCESKVLSGVNSGVIAGNGFLTF